MQISDIKQQNKNLERISVYVDGAYAFSLSQNQLAELGLQKGQALTPPEIEELKSLSTYGKAYDRAIRYIAIRPRSSFEMRTYLSRKGYESSAVEKVVAALHKTSLLDDRTFARQWAEYRQQTAPRSRRRLMAELKQKKIDQEIIDEVLSAYVSEETELGNLKELVEKKRRQSQYQDRQKLLSYLARQGYSYDLIKQAMADEAL